MLHFFKYFFYSRQNMVVIIRVTTMFCRTAKFPIIIFRWQTNVLLLNIIKLQLQLDTLRPYSEWWRARVQARVRVNKMYVYRRSLRS